jgi:hypothetical protein
MLFPKRSPDSLNRPSASVLVDLSKPLTLPAILPAAHAQAQSNKVD